MSFRPTNKRWRSPFLRIRKNESGATAIEFSILALPFIAIVFAVFETSISFTAQQVMSNSVDKLARQIRTGQIDATTTSASQFRDLICDDISLLVDNTCPELEFDLQSYANFAAVPTDIPIDGTTNDINTTGFTYAPGGTGTINHLRVFYRWPVITDIMKTHANLPGGKTLLYSSATWQNEPF